MSFEIFSPFAITMGLKPIVMANINQGTTHPDIATLVPSLRFAHRGDFNFFYFPRPLCNEGERCTTRCYQNQRLLHPRSVSSQTAIPNAPRLGWVNQRYIREDACEDTGIGKKVLSCATATEVGERAVQRSVDRVSRSRYADPIYSSCKATAG
nr:hypothetical protein [Mucilaginibacter sp. FT3.2]